MKPPITLALALLLYTTSQAQQPYRVVSYNLENLYDTIRNPSINDEAFTPFGQMEWTHERYVRKIFSLSKVLSSINDSVSPLFIALQEVENKKVIRDLLTRTSLSRFKLRSIHFDSPDPKGMDVALLYNKAVFKPKIKEQISVSFPFEPSYKTRDMLYVSGNMMGHRLHVFVCHWTSRRGGAAVSEPRRLHLASLLKERIKTIQQKEEDANIILLGDFNDPPLSTSVADTLDAKLNLVSLQKNSLYNLMTEDARQGKFTFNFEGELDILDQIIVSAPLVTDACRICVKNKRAYIYQEPWMMHKTKRYGIAPIPTYSYGKHYEGGPSDHLPVYMDILLK